MQFSKNKTRPEILTPPYRDAYRKTVDSATPKSSATSEGLNFLPNEGKDFMFQTDLPGNFGPLNS
jgi:hypothetical protein